MDTKRQLATTLKELMLIVPVDKITINQLTKRAGVARNTFYYHFDDINGLLEWIFAIEIVEQLGTYKKQKNWQNGFDVLLNYIYENRKFCLNTFKSTNRDLLEHFLYRLAFDMVAGVVTDLHPECPQNLSDEISNFYGRALSSQVVQWLISDMRESKQEFRSRMGRMLSGTIDHIIKHNS